LRFSRILGKLAVDLSGTYHLFFVCSILLSSRVLNLWYRECAPIVSVMVRHLHHLYLLRDDVMLAAIQTFSLLLVVSSPYSSLLLVQRINGSIHILVVRVPFLASLDVLVSAKYMQIDSRA